ncbi:MAG: uncharacterized protein JWM74_4109 [Myxococcaceae bacterium]|nr:uncharacterized protein [Myxococcaceae bacterium]
MITGGVLLLVCAIVFVQLTARERTKLISAKTRAASMLTQLVAIELGAALDFGDADDAAAQLRHLHSNPDIVGASVWALGAQTPTAEWTTSGAPTSTAPELAEADGAITSADWLMATRTVVNRTGAPIARLRITFSLRPENDAFRASRRELFGMTAGLALVTGAVLALLSRRYVVKPLRNLSDAASALARGDLSAARVDVLSNDEIGALTRAFNVMGTAVVKRQRDLQDEMALAQHIQTSVLPRSLHVEALELAATMVPTAEVGGDYYDILPVEHGCWIGIGDVAGHGLDAGLIMLMIQASVAALAKSDPAATPSDVVCAMNAVLYDNIRNRLQRDDHATLTLLRYDRSGRVVFAGAHEDIVVYRAAEQRCEVIATPGTWVGAREDVRRGTVDSSLQLAKGDVMLLYTDGVTEMRDARGEPFGFDRLCAEIVRMHAEPVEEIQRHLLATLLSWSSAPDDDVTFVIARYVG